MATFLNSWQEFKAVLEGTNKKLLKKPNFPLAINQLNSLSLQMQDEELSRHAAVCHSEQASLYAKMGNHNEERKQYLVAAHLLNNNLRQGASSRSRVRSYLPNEITVFYSKAVKLCLEIKAFRLAGMTSLEAANAMIDCNQYEMATEHAQRAARLLEGDFITHTKALYCLATIYFHLSQWELFLAVVDDLWMAIMKNRPKSLMGRKMLKDLEVVTVLILWKTRLSPSGRHKLLMDLYMNNHNTNISKPSGRLSANESSSLSPQEFSVVERFLNFLSLGKVQEASDAIFGSTDLSTVSSHSIRKLTFLSPLAIEVIHLLTSEMISN
ncbi:hypothetical protein Q1695_009392 [Nippostrongylus brasiliensis]|nr:hypothetical protein Q1695_009392 [Nippostrongylus brasiliensis]